MSDFILVFLLLVLLLCLIVTVVGLLLYSGLLSDVIVKTGPPPVRNITIAYKFREGSYKDSGAAYTESCSIGPQLSTVGVFYDDPKQERKLCAFPTIEICGSDVINYMVPLSRQTDFFVPEMKEEVKTDVKEEDSDEDRGTDITGADSHSDVSSVSGGVPWDSRETSLAASTAASLASSLPLRDVMDANEDIKHRDSSERGSNGSIGSGSSFEELDMDQEEQEPGEERGEEEEGDGDEAEVPEGEDAAREAVELVAEKKEPVGGGEE
uniref:Testis expressed 264, ER-phagy receptor a n=1 Tax=Gasterosteus aculeatus aculeatus TaxID=481459 RepID=A0AAQ4PCU9_GASAC